MKSTKYILLLILAFFSELRANAQRHYVGVSNGVAFTSVLSESFLTDITLNSGYSGGLDYFREFENKFILKTGIYFNQKGFKTVFYISDSIGNPINFGEKSDFNYNYLSIPLNIGYRYGNTFYGLIYCGFTISGLVNSNSHLVLGYNEVQNTSTKDVTSLDICPNIGLSQGYSFNNEYNVAFSIEFNQGVVNLANNNYFDGSTIFNRAFLLRLSVSKSFNFEKPYE